MNCRIRGFQSQSHDCPTYTTIMDNGAQQCLLGTRDWLIIKKFDEWIVADGAVGTQATESLRLVDAQTTLLDSSGEAIAIAQVNQGM